jgi:hypothetical protein
VKISKIKKIITKKIEEYQSKNLVAYSKGDILSPVINKIKRMKVYFMIPYPDSIEVSIAGTIELAWNKPDNRYFLIFESPSVVRVLVSNKKTIHIKMQSFRIEDDVSLVNFISN